MIWDGAVLYGLVVKRYGSAAFRVEVGSHQEFQFCVVSVLQIRPQMHVQSEPGLGKFSINSIQN